MEMADASFQHLSNFIPQRTLGLGWLAGVSVMETDRAVTTDWHRHETTELLLCLRGETRYEFRRRPSVTLCAGSFLVVPAGVEHRVSNAIDEPGLRIGLNLLRTSRADRRFAVFEARDYDRMRKSLEADAPVAKPFSHDLKRLVRDLNRLANVRSRRLSSIDCGYVRILCCSILYAAALPSVSASAPTTKLMDEAVRWLEKHLAEKVSTDRLSAFMGYSRARLFTLFREHTGLSPNDYLTRLRIRRAKELLSGGDRAVQDVAAACGFPDNGYFARVFKRQTGFSPLAYRTKVRT